MEQGKSEKKETKAEAKKEDGDAKKEEKKAAPPVKFGPRNQNGVERSREIIGHAYDAVTKDLGYDYNRPWKTKNPYYVEPEEPKEKKFCKAPKAEGKEGKEGEEGKEGKKEEKKEAKKEERRRKRRKARKVKKAKNLRKETRQPHLMNQSAFLSLLLPTLPMVMPRKKKVKPRQLQPNY